MGKAGHFVTPYTSCENPRVEHTQELLKLLPRCRRRGGGYYWPSFRPSLPEERSEGHLGPPQLKAVRPSAKTCRVGRAGLHVGPFIGATSGAFVG
jgi:hypothetical protein